MKVIKLETPLRDTKGPVAEFKFREPRFDDYMILGDPRAPIVTGDKVYYRPIPETVRGYAEKLLVDGDVNILASASLRDTIAIQDAILGFFTDAESRETDTTTSSTSGAPSRSTPERDSPTSAA